MTHLAPTHTETNIVGLPNGPTNKYFTERGYSESYPWKMVAMSASGKTLTIAPVKTKQDPDWKPEMVAGGFCAHCTNQQDQTWLYDGVYGDYTRTIRKNKKGQWVYKGTRFTEDRAIKFHDYNF